MGRRVSICEKSFAAAAVTAAMEFVMLRRFVPVLLLLILAACGAKGPLYLPPPGAPQAPPSMTQPAAPGNATTPAKEKP
jgi:predicted small lipoprotein YifL